MLKNITISQISQTNPLDSTVTIFFNNKVSLEMTPGGVLKMRAYDCSDGENDNIWASFSSRYYDGGASDLQTAVEKFKKLAEAATLMAAEAQRAIEMQNRKDSDSTTVITTTVL